VSTAVVTHSATEFAEYQAAVGLNYSSLKDLMVSPLRFWYLHINPNRPKDEPTPEMQFGSALHCAVLEPSEVDRRYCCRIDEADYPAALDTINDLRVWLKAHGVATFPSASRKQDLIDRALETDPSVQILQVIEENHARGNAGKVQFKKADWYRLGGAANALRSEPEVARILSRDGQAEVSMFATDPETGIRLKARMDWVTSSETMDIKTYSQTRGKSIDKTVSDAIWYEGYYRQAYFYSMVRGLQEGDSRAAAQKAPDFVMAFVESEEPYDIRIRALRPKCAGEANVYWLRARTEVRTLIRLYANCVERWGEKPWRDQREIDVLEDAEIPQLAY
jgi:hypothetical protein